MISSAVPFSLLENPYFQQYQHEIAGPGFEIPRHGKMATHTLSKVHANLEAKTINRILDLDNITLSLDGWTDVAGNSVYALIVLKGPQSRFFIDVLYFHRQQHDARNIISSVKQSLSERCVDIEKACAIVTTSSPLMIEFQNLLRTEHSQILKIQCIQHAFNLMANDLLSNTMAHTIVEGNKTLVEYFVSNDYWSSYIEAWQKDHGIQPGLQTASGNRWFSISKVCEVVHLNRGGFEDCRDVSNDPSFNLPRLPEYILKLIEPNHFEANTSLIALLKPIVDGLRLLESPDMNLSDIWTVILTIYQSVLDASINPKNLQLKVHCIRMIHRQSAIFLDSIYIIGFFLHPVYRRVLKLSLEEITRMVLQVAKYWRFTRSDAISIREQLARYHSNLHPFTFRPESSPFDIKALPHWISVPDSPQTSTLRRFAITVFTIVPHASGVDGLRSIISKPGVQDKLSLVALGKLCQIRYHLLQDMKIHPPIVPTLGPDREHIKLDTAAATPVNHIDRMFDMKKWHQITTHTGSSPEVAEVNEDWELDDILPSFSSKS
ncbi:uncharacterized protein PGTG_00263 [Puccinia graminis f. sp. tritici CRL 75-36-700-3]|uniref:DUF659 domain-containing protein n=1 Tax=Puccinia graminis f. sp. tritici (strain CRL 75-36-700-3 / race SCCL) TaxID=418459 RepID=E3JQK2_PUCGT|nr:uncharacterized protein PGTG_00263 [Puccinia graminis f. sp. tritici CRL 75-36-700-3]EFP74307.2 hypothetical protein PGTG_00263 [Puccinia graminis f. sp. tritici CRL 75-36-700-3]